MNMSEFTAPTQRRIRQFFKLNPDEEVAFPCGHDDLCDHISTRAEATPREATRERPDASCPGCGSNIDRERRITREAANV